MTIVWGNIEKEAATRRFADPYDEGLVSARKMAREQDALSVFGGRMRHGGRVGRWRG